MNATLVPAWNLIEELDDCDTWKWCRFDLGEEMFVEYYYFTIGSKAQLNVYEIIDHNPDDYGTTYSFCPNFGHKSFRSWTENKFRILEIKDAHRWSWETHKERLLSYVMESRL